MKNVYKVISSYSTEDTNKGLSRLDTRENEIADKIIDDMIAIIHHFSSKIYSSRKRKKIIESITSEEINLLDVN